LPKIVTCACAAASAGLFLAALGGPAMAAGFYLQEQSVKGLARAYSGEAADVGAESLWWNPAAIADVQGLEIYGGLNGVFSDTKVTDRGSTIRRPGQPAAAISGEHTANNPLEPGVVPNLDAAWRVNEHIALGLAVSAPFDFTTKYGGSSFARFQAQTSRLVDLDVQPTIAFHINRYVDLGAGVDAQYAQSTLSSSLPNLSPLAPDGDNRLHGDGWNFGWTAGAQLHPTERLSIGASYRSQIDHELTGGVSVSGLLGPLAGWNGPLRGKAKFTTPWIAVLGARYVLDDHWAFNGQLQRVGWSTFDAIRVGTSAGTTLIAQGYHDTTTEAVGVDYTVNPKLTLRAGVAYDPTPTPDTGRSTRVPDGDRVLITVGVTARPSARLELDAALAYIDLARSRIVGSAADYAGTPAATPIAYNALATGNAFIVSYGLKYKF
jgi:long-chain fatty acid transport protein